MCINCEVPKSAYNEMVTMYSYDSGYGMSTWHINKKRRIVY